MARYLIRSVSGGDWMVWDRAQRGPATIGDRKLVRLSRQAAERALASLLATNPETNLSPVEFGATWQIVYGHQSIDCRDEHEAKIIARKLIGKRGKIAARIVSGARILRTIEGHDLRAWLSE